MARRSVVIDLEVRNKQARASLEGIESGFTNLRQSIDDPMPVRFDVDRARASLQGIESGVTSLRKSTQQASSIARQSTGAMASGFNRASQSVRGNIQPVQSLTRIVEDAPFGVRGVANNINPFIQSFQRMGNASTTTAQKMKMLLTSAFTGPGAILTISALVTSAITAIQMGLFDWGEEAESTEEQMETLMESVDEFIDEQRQMEGQNIFDPLGQATTEQRLDEIQALKDELQTLFDLRTEARELGDRIADIRAGGQMGFAADVSSQQEQMEQLNQQIATQERLLGELSDAQADAVNEKIKDMEATQRVNQALIRLNPALQLQMNLNESLRPVLRDVELGLSGAQDELESLIEEWEAEADQIRENIEAGEFQGEQLEYKKDVLNTITEALDQSKQAQEDLTDQEKSAANATRDLARARRELADQMGVEDELMGMADIDTELEDDIARDTRIGSIADLRAELEELNEEWENTQRGTERFRELNQQIAIVEGQLQQATGSIQQAGDAGSQAILNTSRSTDMLISGLVQAKLRGEELEETLQRLATQMIPRAIMGIFSSLFGGGALGFISGDMAKFATSMFDESLEGTLTFAESLGFAHGTDMGFPGIGRVGERGEELLVAPPMSSVITNENVERMDQWRSEARQGAANISQMGGSQIEGAVMNAFSRLDLSAETRTEARDIVTMIRMELDQQGGKGGDGTL